MSFLRNNFMQSIFTGKPTVSSAPLPPSLPVLPIAQTRFFLFKIVREQDKADPYAHVHTLHEDEQYIIVVTCNENAEQLAQDQSWYIYQQPVTINGAFELRLKIESPYGKLPFNLSYEDCLISSDQIFKKGPDIKKPEISFSLPKYCPSLDLTFSFYYREIESSVSLGSSSVVRRTFPVEGSLTPEDPGQLEAAYIATGLPEEAIVLTVLQRRGTSICDIRGWSARQKVLSTELDTESLPNITAALKNQKDSPRTVVSKIAGFSYSKIGKLAPWLLSLLNSPAKAGANTPYTVIIFEESDQEIPWELLEVGPDQYLGAISRVSRWLPVEGYGQKRYLKVADEQCQGSVLSYLDTQSDSVDTEEKLLALFTNETLPSLGALRNRLQRKNALQQVGLVYLGCHGEDGSTLFSTTSLTDHLQSTVKELTALDFTSVKRLMEPLPTFFINACESARLHKKNLAILNFVKNILSRCASNYIGTLAPIGTTYAATIANRILALALETQGVQIAELLRLLRTEVVQDMDEYLDHPDSQDEDEVWYLFLFTFLYAYYGNPFARLSLSPAPPKEVL